MYKCRNFDIQEFVSKAVYQKFGQNAWMFLNPGLMEDNDHIRDLFGPTYCNNWDSGGQYDSRGFRHPDDPDGVDLSIHKNLGATDLTFMFQTVKDFSTYFLKNKTNKALFIYPEKTAAIIEWAAGKMIPGMVEMVRQYIIANPSEFPHITRLETGVSWLHNDAANVDTSKGKVLFHK